MRYRILIWGWGVVSAAAPLSASTVNITLEARTLGADVLYEDVAGGFILDVILEADEPMRGAMVTLTGDSGFHHLGTEGTPGMPGQNHYGPAWDGGDVNQVPPGYLPLSGGIGNELVAEAWDQINGAPSGLFAWLEFDALPIEGEYFITPAGVVTGLDDLPMDIGIMTPLHIVPEPANAVLLALAAFMLIKRERN